MCRRKEPITNQLYNALQDKNLAQALNIFTSFTLDCLSKPTQLKLSSLSHLVTRHCFVYFVVLWEINCAFIYIQHFLSDFAAKHEPSSPDPRNFQWRQVIYGIFKQVIELGLGRGFQSCSLIHTCGICKQKANGKMWNHQTNNGEAEGVGTSCFARQTGSVGIFPAPAFY